jgi:tetratricopeptide (TPR) repeat protein
MIKNRFVFWFKKLKKKSSLGFKIIEKTWVVLTVLATLIGIPSGYISLKTSINSTVKASEFFNLSKKYFLEERDYDKTIEYGKKAYNIDCNIADLKYYYTLALYLRNKGDDLKQARNILFENSFYLNNREKAVYGILEYRREDYTKANEIFESITSFSDIDTHLLPMFIACLSKTTFKAEDYNVAVSKIQKYYLMLQKAFYANEGLGLIENNIKLFSNKISYMAHDVLDARDDVSCKEEAKVIIGNDLYLYAHENNDNIRCLAGLKIGSEGFAGLAFFGGSDMSSIYQYLQYLTDYMTYKAKSKEEMDEISPILKKIESDLSSISFDSTIYVHSNEELKFAVDIFIDNNNLNWKKFNINLKDNLSLRFFIGFSEDKG